MDFSGVVHDSFLSSLDLVKGKRKVVNHEERGRVLGALDGKSYKVSAGGSLSNTLVALARLGIGRGLRVAMTGSVGSDPLGDFYRCGRGMGKGLRCWSLSRMKCRVSLYTHAHSDRAVRRRESDTGETRHESRSQVQGPRPGL